MEILNMGEQTDSPSAKSLQQTCFILFFFLFGCKILFLTEYLVAKFLKVCLYENRDIWLLLKLRVWEHGGGPDFGMVSANS